MSTRAANVFSVLSVLLLLRTFISGTITHQLIAIAG